MRKIKIAQIGIGHDHAADSYRTLYNHPEQFDLVGWCAVEGEEDSVDLMKTRYDFYAKTKQLTLDEILNMPDLEAVLIETGDWDLTKYARMAAEKNLHVRMDKPGGADAVEFEELLRTMKKTGKVFQIGYMYRYNPKYLEILDMVEKGEIGTIYSVEAHMDCEHGAPKRAWLGKLDGGMMQFLGCHLVDLIFRLQGVPEEILALNTSSGFDGVTAKDIGFAVFRYKNGVSFAKTAACEPGGFMRRQLVVCGEKRTVTLLPFERFVEGGQKTDMRVCEKGVEGWGYDGVHSSSDAYGRYDAMFDDFYRFVTEGRQNPYTLEYEARLHRILLAACGAQVDYKGEIKL